MARNCPRHFTILADGGVVVRWACGAEKVFPHERSIDIEILADHLPPEHHHKHHLHHK